MTSSVVGQKRLAGALLAGVVITAIACPPVGLAVGAVAFVAARRAGWVAVSRVCLAIAILLAAWAVLALLSGVGVHVTVSSGQMPGVSPR